MSAYLLNSHHNLDGIQAVQAKVVGEVGNAGDLVVMGVSVRVGYRSARV